MSVQFVVRHSEHKGLIGPFLTREAAWAWVNALPPYPHAASASVLPVRTPV